MATAAPPPRSLSPTPPSSSNNNSNSNNNAGSISVVAGVEEVSGLHYSAICDLDRQYQAPIGQRLMIFVRANANCCLQGGVETILKLQKSKGLTKMAVSSSSSSPVPSTHSSTNSLVDQAPNEGGGGDGGSYLQDNGEESYYQNNFDDPTAASSSSGKRGPNLGRFLKKVAKQTTSVAKQTTATLERGMQELAIKADQGRNPDLLTVGLFASDTGALLSMTDAVPLPRVSVGVSFGIPLWIPTGDYANSQVTLKLFIHSQASLMISSATGKSKTRYFLLGHSQMSVGQIRQLLQQQRKGFFSMTLASNLVEDGQLHCCVLPDMKIPAIGQRGWSLIDPQFSGFVSGAYNIPLDQSYLIPSALDGSQAQQQQPWLVATERAIESTVVLPLATAFARLAAHACQVSVHHSKNIAAYLMSKRTEQKDPGDCARVQVDVQYVQLDMGSMAQSATMNLVWQPPDSIFELELLPSVMVPVCQPGQTVPQSQQQQPSPTLQFFPPVCKTGILPAILKGYGGRMPPGGYMLGNLRFQMSNPASSSKSNPEVWETLIVLEQHVIPNGQAKQQVFPVYAVATGHKVASIALTLRVHTEAAAVPVPPPVSPQQGLVALVGLENLIEGVIPCVDFDGGSTSLQQQQNPQQAAEMKRRHQQLATMGNFMSFAYLDQHIRHKREADLILIQERASQYLTALERDNRNNAPRLDALQSWEDKSPRPFRPSASRLEVLLSGIPFNTHNASWSIDVVDPTNNTQPPTNAGALFHNITCGAPSDHSSGFGNVFVDKTFASPIGSVSGGLRRLESKRQELAQTVRAAQAELINGVASYFQTARQQQRFLNHVPARHQSLQNLRWKVFEAVHAYHHVTWICATRRAAAFSQALGIAATSFLTALSDTAKCQAGWPQHWARHGYLVSYEGLLSAAGKELGMIEDASVAISMLRMVRIVLVPDDSTVTPARVIVPHSPIIKWVHVQPSPNGPTTQYNVQIGLHPHYFEHQIPPCLKNGAGVQLFPVLFQVGVDIRQWGAHAGSNVKNQLADAAGATKDSGGMLDDEDDDAGVSDDDVLVALNYEALGKMNTYAHSIYPIQGSQNPSSGNPFDSFNQPPSNQNSAQQLNGMPVHPSLQMLHSHIMTSHGKMNHSIVDEAATMAQNLGGGGVVFCKSGKDRTAMHLTYKQAQFANRFRQHGGNGKQQEAADTTIADATRMRIYGTRLPICEKNVGQALYAFNALQSKFMPDALKPPPSTLAGFLKGGRLLQGGGIES